MCKNKILLIENQLFQYKLVRANLCEKFSIFPIEKDFVEVTDWARISLTKRYDKNSSIDPNQKRKMATENLINYINDNRIDLILMDHVLVGHHSGENGIQLAEKLQYNGIDIPIIFLSRTPENDQKVKDQLSISKIKNIIWVEKGYAGQGIGDDWYFKLNVVDKINERIVHSINTMLDTLIIPVFDNLTKRINELRKKYWTKVQKDKLKSFLEKNPNLSLAIENDLLKIIEEVESGDETGKSNGD